MNNAKPTFIHSCLAGNSSETSRFASAVRCKTMHMTTNLDDQLPPRTHPCFRFARWKKSLRWLALVVSQRLQLMQPKGRQRMREAGDARRGFALPKAVISKVGAPGRTQNKRTTACSGYTQPKTKLTRYSCVVELCGGEVSSRYSSSELRG